MTPFQYSLEPYMKLEEAFSASNPADLREVIEKNSSLFAAVLKNIDFSGATSFHARTLCFLR